MFGNEYFKETWNFLWVDLSYEKPYRLFKNGGSQTKQKDAHCFVKSSVKVTKLRESARHKV